ncbi:MAG: hypothetical protein ABSF10_19755 [Verrucomicrobiota bacterium]|jgi:hypothetical protein
MKRPEFDLYEIADVSMKHITKEDGRLIGRQDAPGHVACVDPEDAQSGSPGDVFAVLLDSRLHRRQIADLREFGFSSAFVRIFRALYQRRVPYVRFDAGGGEVEGLAEFEW